MKRLFLSAAVLPLLHAAPALAQTTISTATTQPLSTAATGELTIAAGGSIVLAAPGAAVTIDSNNAVANAGTLSFNDVSGATGILAQAGVSGRITNTGTISLVEDYTPTDADGDGDLDGAFASGGQRIGVDVVGPFTGDVRNDAGTITVEGQDSAGIRVQGLLTGNLVNSGAISVTGDRAVGVQAASVAGDAILLGSETVQGEGAVAVSLGDVAGRVQIQGVVSATGYRSATRIADDTARGKLDADDLKQGGSAIRITGSVGRGLLLDAPPPDTDTANTDEDGDGLVDSAEGTAAVTSYGASPAIDLGGTGATTYGVGGTGEYGYGLVVRGGASANGVNDGVGATTIRIGQDGGGAVNIAGGVNILGGVVSAQAYGAETTANGSAATAILINGAGVVPSLRNTGTIQATLIGGSQDARAVVDLSGTLSLVDNYGLISATSTPRAGSANIGRTIALDLRANTTGATVRQSLATSTSTPSIVGDVLLGGGDDRLELLGGTLKGAMDFGAGADTLLIDNGAAATGRVTSAGSLAVNVANGRLAVSNTAALQLSSLNMGAKGVLAVAIDPAANTATHLNVTGAATIASGAQFDLTLSSLLRGQATYELIRAGSLSIGDATASLVGSPYLYMARLTSNTTTGVVGVDLRPKTASELGLSGSGAQAFSAVFNSLDQNKTIQNAFLAAEGKAAFEGLYDQMLPDHSGAALMSAQTISSAISQAISRPALRDVKDDGGMWAQEIVFRLDHDRERAQGFRSQGFGLATGVETVGMMNALGLSASFVTTEFRDKAAATGEQVAMNFFEGGAYWRFEAGGLKADVRGGVGYVHFDSERLLVDPSASLNLKAKAKWDGWLADAHAGVAYEARAGAFYVRPELSADYLRLSEGSYDEAGGGAGFDLSVDGRKGDLLTGQALLALGARFGDELYFSPEVKVGYRARLAGDPGSTTARFAVGSGFTLDPEDVSGKGIVARAGIKGGTEYMLFSLDGGGVFGDAFKQYDLHATVRFKF